jgi:hypothetical protein
MGTTTKQASLDKIKCPNCGEMIPITETLHQQLAEQAREELKTEALEHQKALAARENALKKKEAELVSAEKDIDQKEWRGHGRKG